MILDGDLVSPATIVHEMTHAYNDIIVGMPWYEKRKDEGMGSAMQSFDALARVLKNIQISLQAHPCDYELTKRLWQDLRKHYGTVPSGWWGTGSGSAWSDEEFKLDMNDLTNIKSILGVRLSCEETAAAVNAVLSSSSADCCLRVKCAGADSGYHIGPGTVIMPFFD
jgi:hypothetical protein